MLYPKAMVPELCFCFWNYIGEVERRHRKSQHRLEYLKEQFEFTAEEHYLAGIARLM